MTFIDQNFFLQTFPAIFFPPNFLRWPIWTFLNSLPYNTRVLITSRDTLPPIEVHNYELDRLDNDKSKVLFWKTLRNAGYFKDRKALSIEETQVLAEIVDTLEGYPLAVIGKWGVFQG